MIGPLGRLGAAATLRRHCPQMTQRPGTTVKENAKLWIWLKESQNVHSPPGTQPNCLPLVLTLFASDISSENKTTENGKTGKKKLREETSARFSFVRGTEKYRRPPNILFPTLAAAAAAAAADGTEVERTGEQRSGAWCDCGRGRARA